MSGLIISLLIQGVDNNALLSDKLFRKEVVMRSNYQGVNPSEAPDGYIAVLKSEVKRGTENICNFCDWRPECQNRSTDFDNPSLRCMPDPMISSKSGKEIKRQDNCSVVFKKFP